MQQKLHISQSVSIYPPSQPVTLYHRYLFDCRSQLFSTTPAPTGRCTRKALSLYNSLSFFFLSREKKKDSMFFFLSLKKNSTSLSPFFRNLHTTENGFQSTEATPTSLPYCLPYNYRRGRKKINTHVHCQIHYYHLCFIILFFNLDLKSRNEANEFMSSALREWSTINYILLQHNSIKRFVLFYDKLKRFSFSISLIYSLSCFKSAMAALAMLDSGVPNGSWIRTCTASFKKTSASLSSFVSWSWCAWPLSNLFVAKHTKGTWSSYRIIPIKQNYFDSELSGIKGIILWIIETSQPRVAGTNLTKDLQQFRTELSFPLE